MPTRRTFTAALMAAMAAGCARTGPLAPTTADTALRHATPPGFDPASGTPMQLRVGEVTVAVRAWEGLPTVARPVAPAHQAINLYVPEAYFHGGRVGRYTARTAPIFLPNAVGGYMPALPAKPTDTAGPPPAPGQTAPPGAIAQALARGLVVAAPGARGRSQQDGTGRWIGKAPAAIVDLKAAVRWLRHHADRLPGRTDRIVSNGTSAGGALSALLGASGNAPDHDAELREIGALPGRDDVFAVSAYCPITALALADAAYEWQFQGLTEYRNVAVSMLDFRVQRQEVVGRLDAAQQALSDALRRQFAQQVEALGLLAPDGTPLRAAADGGGSLRDHLAALLAASARQAAQRGTDLSGRPWLTLTGTGAPVVDFAAYVRAIGRMKALPAFDGLALETGENQLFGDDTTDRRHFTAFSAQHGSVPGAALADAATVRRMDALQQALDTRTTVAPHWRIRHGTLDRDTALAVPALLAAAVRRRGADTDLALAWDRPHSGDYDLDELFAWIDDRVGRG